MSHVTLANGCHYWKVRIDQFTGASNNGFVAIGVAKEVDDGRPIGMLTSAYEPSGPSGRSLSRFL